MLFNDAMLTENIVLNSKNLQNTDMVFRSCGEGGDCGLLLYLSSITHLKTHDYSCQNSKSR